MTSPIEEIEITCLGRGNRYKDWFRGSINLDLDDFDDGYVEEATTSTCRTCTHKVSHNALIVEEGQFGELTAEDSSHGTDEEV